MKLNAILLVIKN